MLLFDTKILCLEVLKWLEDMWHGVLHFSLSQLNPGWNTLAVGPWASYLVFLSVFLSFQREQCPTYMVVVNVKDIVYIAKKYLAYNRPSINYYFTSISGRQSNFQCYNLWRLIPLLPGMSFPWLSSHNNGMMGHHATENGNLKIISIQIIWLKVSPNL